MRQTFNQLKANKEYNLIEDDINELGYRLLYDKKDPKSALEVFKLNACKFPESYDVWDSLGEVYYQIGNREEAVKHYEKSLQLNPKNEGGRQMLEKIRGEKRKTIVRSQEPTYQFNGGKGETATLLLRCPLNLNGLGGGFARRHLNRSADLERAGQRKDGVLRREILA